ncbi:MAG: hypothetical protein HKN58_02260 [Xanthomonadales bacterium]|nr:hypothetical protein [Xanthomonadales bacterium]
MAGLWLSLLASAGLPASEGDALGDAQAAIESVLEQDSRLGAERNEATRHMPIARVIEQYVAGLDALDLASCPEDFMLAMRRHRDAWQASVKFFEAYPELRGEMHEVFERIRAQGAAARSGLEGAEAAIWGTWAEVENAVQGHAPAGEGDPG